MAPQVARAPTLVEADVIDLSHDGRGVARVNGKAVFVTGALPGERVRLRVVRKRKDFDEAEVDAVLTPSPDRVAPGCAHFGVCGGCVLQHLAPEAQIAAKQRVLLENFERIGKVAPARVLPPLTSEPWGYRRRARLSAKWVAKKDKLLVGFRETNGRYVADIARCEVLVPSIGARVAEIGAMLATLDGREQMPQLEVAVGDRDAALTLRHLQPLSDGDRAKLEAFAKSSGIAIFLQPGGVDSVVPLTPDTPAELSFALPEFDLEFKFRPLDFVQVNAAMNQRMVVHALDLLSPRAEDRVLDLFCGLGNFTLPLARRAGSVVGVEGDAGLIERARENASRNGIGNVEYFAANLFEDVRSDSWARRDYDLLLLDPPRAGAQEILQVLPRKSTRRVVYVSCHPGSLARDSAILVNQHGFKLDAAGVMDMFPHTAHVESIAIFNR